MLSDMEELISRIQNKAMVDYMREAIGCYHVGAFRGCIVLSYIALFDDLSEKLHELASTNATAKIISKDVKKRQNGQDIFETYMVDQLKSKKLITEAEASTLEQVRVCRNKAAHPSGVHASPEEARFVFFEVIDKFLSKKLLLTTQAVDALLLRLENANFFPTSDIKETKSIVENELTSLHDAALPFLVKRLVDTCDGSDQTAAKNAQRFIVGLSYLRRPDLTELIRKRLVKAKADDTNFHALIVRTASANAEVLDKHDTSTYLRIQNLLNTLIDKSKSSVAVTQLSHPVYLLGSMLEMLGEANTLDLYNDVAHKIIEKYRYTGSLVKKISKASKLKKFWLTSIKAEAGSSTFDFANRFAKNVPDIDDLLTDIIKPKDAFILVVAVCEAADTGAFTSKDLRAGKFSAVPNLKEMAITYSTTTPKTAGRVIKKSGVSKNLITFVGEYLEDKG